jgi:hypothetical protein
MSPSQTRAAPTVPAIPAAKKDLVKTTPQEPIQVQPTQKRPGEYCHIEPDSSR